MSGVNIQFIFNPQNCSLEQLDATLTRNRRDLANLILDHIRDSIETGGSYNDLIIGPRGTGKTHLVHYIRKTLTELEYPPGGHINVIHLAEEERGITTLLHFLLSCLRAAGIPSRTLIDLFSREDPVLATQKAVDFFRDFTKRKPTLLIIENLSDIFSSLDENGIKALRGFLQNNPFISLLASSVFLFEKSSKPDHPFYGYFDIHPLDYLETEEAQDFLKMLAKSNGQTDLYNELKRKKSRRRVKAIQVLAGGNHRLLAMLSFFLNPQSLDDLVLPFQQMADRELTPYYQQRLNCLSAQQNRILEAIAEHHGKAINVKEIAQYAFLDPNAVSRQLCDLLSAGFVQRDQKGRESYYELREPLLRLVLDMKEGRDKPLSTIVQLLRAWYEAEELEGLALMAPAVSQIYYRHALVEKEDETKAQEALQGAYKTEDLSMQKQPVKDLDAKKIKEIIALLDAGKPETALEKINSDILAAPDNIHFILLKGIVLRALGRNEEEITVYDEVVTRFGKSNKPEFLELVASALLNKGVALGAIDRNEEKITVYDEVTARFGKSDRPKLLELVAGSLFNKVNTLRALGRNDEEIAIYDEVVARFGKSDRPKLLELVASALFSKGAALGALGRNDEAIAACDEVAARFGKSDRPELLKQVASALVNKGAALGAIGRHEEEITVYDEAVARFGKSDRHELLEQVARALFNKGNTLGALGRNEEAIAIYAEVVARFGKSDRPELLKQVASALVNKGATLGALGRHEEEITVYDEVVARFGKSDQPKLLELVASALANKGAPLGWLGRHEEAIAACDDALRIDQKNTMAMTNKILNLLDLHREEEGLQVINHFIVNLKPKEEQCSMLIFYLLERSIKNANLLQKIITPFIHDERLLIVGLSLWLRSQLSNQRLEVKDIEKAEENLKKALSGMPAANQIITILNAVKRYSSGDNKALLDIPLELRHLILKHLES